MKKIFRKNQLIITALAVMIAVAGYMNFSSNMKDDYLAAQATKKTDYETADTTLSENEIFTDTEASANDTGGEDAGETVLTGSGSVAVDRAAELRLNREQTRAANKATLAEVMNNAVLTEQERTAAVQELAKLTDISERESACELMLETKGFEGAVVSITDNEADVVVNMAEVTDAQRAQIEDVVQRKGNIQPENLIISTMAEAQK